MNKTKQTFRIPFPVIVICILSAALTSLFAVNETDINDRITRCVTDNNCSKERAVNGYSEIIRIKCWLKCLESDPSETEQYLYSYNIASKIDEFLVIDKRNFKDNVDGFTTMREVNNLLYKLFGEIKYRSKGGKGNRSQVNRVLSTARKLERLTIDLADLKLLESINNYDILCNNEQLHETLNSTDTIKHLAREDRNYAHLCNIKDRLSENDINILKDPDLKQVLLYLVACEKVYNHCLYGAERKPVRQQKACKNALKRRNTPKTENWYQGCVDGIDRHLKEFKKSDAHLYSTTLGYGIYYGNNPYTYLTHFPDRGKGMACSTRGTKIININHHHSDTGLLNLRVLERVGIIVPGELREGETLLSP
jgi:hypothetical protein